MRIKDIINVSLILVIVLLPTMSHAWLTGYLGKHHESLVERVLQCISTVSKPVKENRCKNPVDNVLTQALKNGAGEPDQSKTKGGDGTDSPKHSYNVDYKPIMDTTILQSLGLSQAIIDAGGAIQAIKDEKLNIQSQYKRLECRSKLKDYADLWHAFGRLSHYAADIASPLHSYSVGIDGIYHEGDINSQGQWYKGLWDLRGGDGEHGKLELAMGKAVDYDSLACTQIEPINVARNSRAVMRDYISIANSTVRGYEGLIYDFNHLRYGDSGFFKRIGQQQANDAVGSISQSWVDAAKDFKAIRCESEPPAGECDGCSGGNCLPPGGGHPDDTFDVSTVSMPVSSKEIRETIWDRYASKKNKKSLTWYWMQGYLQGLRSLGNIDVETYNNYSARYELTSATASDLFYDDYITTPDIAILGRGFALSLSDLLQDKLYEPIRRMAVEDFSPEAIKDYPTLVIPSGGLMGLENSAIFKASLDEYVKRGGTVLVLAQQHGYEYTALPTPDGKPITAYGWDEDQNCFADSVYIETWHPMVAGQTRTTPTINVDGYFTRYPQNATVILRRTANGQLSLKQFCKSDKFSPNIAL